VATRFVRFSIILLFLFFLVRCLAAYLKAGNLCSPTRCSRIVGTTTSTFRENVLPREQLNPTVLENPRGTKCDTHGNLIWIASTFRARFTGERALLAKFGGLLNRLFFQTQLSEISMRRGHRASLSKSRNRERERERERETQGRENLRERDIR